MKTPQKTFYNSGGNFPNSKNKKKTTLKKCLLFQEIEHLAPKHLIKLFYTLNKTPLRETGFLSNLYHLRAIQASSFLTHRSPLSRTESVRTHLVPYH